MNIRYQCSKGGEVKSGQGNAIAQSNVLDTVKI